MIKETVAKAINNQIMKEMFSSNLYLAMAGYYHSINLNGFANWMRAQAQEEMFHAMKFFDYLLARGGKVEISAIDKPQSVWNNCLEAFNSAYEHEQFVSESISNLADLAIKEGDHATHVLLQWFISEQVEEEANTSEIVEKLKMIGDFTGGLIMMDNELKTRVFTPPVTAAD